MNEDEAIAKNASVVDDKDVSESPNAHKNDDLQNQSNSSDICEDENVVARSSEEFVNPLEDDKN